jgi:Tol biopolymer transport system component
VREFADQGEAATAARARLTALKPATPSTISVRRVRAPNTSIFGAPSRDGAYLTFTDESRLDVAICELATGQIRHLTKHQSVWEFALASMPSPDGKLVAYTWDQDGRYELRVVGLEGTEPRVLYSSNAEVTWLELADWSPDGNSILAIFSRRLALVSVADGSVRVLKNSVSASPGRPRFSPDGRYIAYDLPQGPGSAERDIFLLAPDTGRETPLIQHPADDLLLDWTPDGRAILFRSDRTGTMGAWLMRVADGKPQGTPELVKPDLGRALTPMGFTRDGSYYYGVRTEMNDVYIAELDLATGKLTSAPSPATQRFVGSNERPDWSPDGQQLLYLSRRAPGAWGARALCVRSTESGEVRELVSKLNRVSYVRWSPDGRSLLANAQHPTGEFGRFRIDVQTGDFERIVVSTFGWPAAWSGDGKAIFYHQLDSATNRSTIVVRDLETGQEKELHSLPKDSSNYAGGLAVSRDGRQLAFQVSESGSRIIKVMPAAGGEARDLLREVRLPISAPIAWAPDGLSLLFGTQTSPGGLKTELWLISVQGGEPRKLELTAENMRDLSVHPDGRHVAFTAGQRRSEVWVMENFLPKAAK